MKNKNIIDERIMLSQQKIESDACRILLIILLASIFIQQFAFQADFSQYIVELLATVGIVIYIAMRNIIAGNDYTPDLNGRVKPIVTNALITGAGIAIVNSVLNFMQYGDRYSSVFLFIVTQLVTFISATLGAAILFSLFSLLSVKGQERFEKKLENED